MMGQLDILGNYTGEPASGHNIAFANIISSLLFTQKVENGIIDQWIKVGGSVDNLTINDNAYNYDIAKSNALEILSSPAEVFIEFQFDKGLNEWLPSICPDDKYIIAVDIPILGFPFMGVNNQRVGEMAGNWAKNRIMDIGWGNVDNVFYNRILDSDTEVLKRSQASIDVLKSEYGEDANPDNTSSKAFWFNSISTGETKEYFTQWLQNNSDSLDGHTNIVFCLNDQNAQGVTGTCN